MTKPLIYRPEFHDEVPTYIGEYLTKLGSKPQACFSLPAFVYSRGFKRRLDREFYGFLDKPHRQHNSHLGWVKDFVLYGMDKKIPEFLLSLGFRRLSNPLEASRGDAVFLPDAILFGICDQSGIYMQTMTGPALFPITDKMEIYTLKPEEGNS